MKNRNDWHLLEKEKVLGLLGTDFFRGLSDGQVKRQRLRWGSGTVWQVKHASAGQIALAVVLDLATVLLLISVAAAAVFDRGVEAGLIAGILLIGGILRAVTYIRAIRILEDTAKERIPVSSVIRNGRVCLLPANQVVVGDIVYLEEGDTVPCDGRVIAGEDSLVDESGITENKEPVHKFDTVIATESSGGEVPCEYRSNCVFAGSQVLDGSLRIVATAVGKRTLIAMKQGVIDIEPDIQLPAVEALARRSRNTSLVVIACVLILTVLSMFVGDGEALIDVFLCSMAMAAAAMSEFLTMIGTIIVALTVHGCASPSERRDKGDARSGKKRLAGLEKKSVTMIREPSRLEDIANLHKVIFCGSAYFKSGKMELCAYYANGIYTELDEAKNGYTAKEGIIPSADRVLNLAMAACTAENRSLASAGNGAGELSETVSYLLRGADAYVLKTGEHLESGYALMDHMDACAKSAGLNVSLIMDGGNVVCAAAGKIDAVLRACTMADSGEGPVPVTDAMRRELYTRCAELEFSGARVIAVAHRISLFDQLNRVSVLTEYMTFAGFVAVSQEWEANGADNVRFIKQDGICPILFTEDAEGDLYYCHRLGLFDKRTKIVSAVQATADTFRNAENGVIVSFAGLSDLSAAYAGVTQLVLQSEEEGSVAVLGRKSRDGNAVALADVGCAVADTPMRAIPGVLSGRAVMVVHPSAHPGTEARYGGLDGVIRAVYASRQALENVESAKLYLTSSMISRLILMLASVLLPLPMLSPVSILIWGILFDFAAVLMMAFEAGHGDRIRPKLRKKPVPQEDDMEEASSSFRGLMAPLAVGGIWGLTVAASSWLYGYLAALSKTGSREQLFLSCALILSGLIVSCSVMKNGSLFRHGPINVTSLSFVLICGLLIPVILIGADLPLLGTLLLFGVSLIPSSILLAVFEIFKGRAGRK